MDSGKISRFHFSKHSEALHGALKSDFSSRDIVIPFTVHIISRSIKSFVKLNSNVQKELEINAI